MTRITSADSSKTNTEFLQQNTGVKRNEKTKRVVPIITKIKVVPIITKIKVVPIIPNSSPPHLLHRQKKSSNLRKTK